MVHLLQPVSPISLISITHLHPSSSQVKGTCSNLKIIESVPSTLALGTTPLRQSSSVSKVLIQRQSTVAPFLHATRLSSSTNRCILEENDLSTSTWTEICSGVGIRSSKHTPTVCVSPVLAKTAISWPRTSISGNVSHSLFPYC